MYLARFTEWCDGCVIALHADDVNEVAKLVCKLQCANVSNLISVVVAHCNV